MGGINIKHAPFAKYMNSDKKRCEIEKENRSRLNNDNRASDNGGRNEERVTLANYKTENNAYESDCAKASQKKRRESSSTFLTGRNT
jgi:hypothetical protein